MVIKCLEQIRKKSLLLSSLNPIEVPYARQDRLFFDVSEPRVPELSGTLISQNFPTKSSNASRVSHGCFLFSIYLFRQKDETDCNIVGLIIKLGSVSINEGHTV